MLAIEFILGALKIMGLLFIGLVILGFVGSIILMIMFIYEASADKRNSITQILKNWWEDRKYGN